MGMATSGQLIEKVAEVCGLPAVTVGTYYKALREAGLTNKSGRGPSAALMTMSDVANLLIALTSGASAKDSPAAVRRIRGFKRQSKEGTLREGILDSFIGGKDFGTFFEELLTLELNGRLEKIMSEVPHDAFRKSPDIAKLYRAQGYKKSDREVAFETSYYIGFNIDDDWIEVGINRKYANRENEVDGAFFQPDENDWDRTPGIVTTKNILKWAIVRIVVLLKPVEAVH